MGLENTLEDNETASPGEGTPEGRRRPFRPQDLLWMLAATAVLLFAFRRALLYDPGATLQTDARGMEGWLFSSTASSPWLTYGLAAWFGWRRRTRVLLAWRNPGAPGRGYALLGAAAALFAWGLAVDLPSLLVASFSLQILGLAWVTCGPAGARALALPALILLFAIPLPAVLLNRVIFELQALTAWWSDWLLTVIGVETQRLGDRIWARGAIFQVIETCSGLRAVETLSFTAFVYWEIFRQDRVQLAILLLAAPIVALLLNGVRVATIVLSPLSEFGQVHTLQGMAALFLGVLTLAGIDRVQSRLRGHPAAGRWLPPVRPGATDNAAHPIAMGVAAASIGLLAVLSVTTSPFSQPSSPGRSLHDLPSRLGDWSSQGIPVDLAFQGSVSYTQRVHRRFRSDAGDVDLFLGTDDHRRRQHSALSPKNRIPGSGYAVVSQRDLRGLPLTTEVREQELRSLGSRVLAWSWSDGFRPLTVETLRASLGLDRLPFPPRPRGRTVRIVTPVGEGPGAVEAARERLTIFASALLPALADLERAASRAEPSES